MNLKQIKTKLERRGVIPIPVGYIGTLALLAILGYFIHDLVIPQTVVDFWAMITGLASCGLLLIAYRGLKSLGLTKRDMLTRAAREARQSAVTRCEEFANEIIPMNAPILNALATRRIKVFVENAGDVSLDPDNKDHLDDAIKWLQTLPPETRTELLLLLNRLEAWCMYFTNQLADPDIAFGPCAPLFCSFVVQAYPELLFRRNNSSSSGKYPNLVKLFKAWLAKLETEKRGIKQGDLLKELRKLQEEGVRTGDTLLRPLGTEIDD